MLLVEPDAAPPAQQPSPPPRRPSAVPKPPPRLLSRREVRAAIHRERLLSLRAGRAFSCVTFACATRQSADLLRRTLAVRLRDTDDVGVSPRELCAGMRCRASRCVTAILRETTPAGAGLLAADVLARFDDRDRPAHRVHVLGETFPAGPDRPAAPLPPRGLPAWKRGVDVAVAASGLLALLPLMALVALAIKLDSRGPAVFWQKRAGRGGRPFRIAKFRTMVADAERLRDSLVSEQDGAAFKLRRDPRVTRVGLLLRATSLDELPQLWNVLIGEMTLVGPRPLPVGESDACQPWHRRRLEVTPGLTCIWQVHGRSRVGFDEWMRMDLRYVRRSQGAFGVVHDATLLAKTLPAVFVKRGF